MKGSQVDGGTRASGTDVFEHMVYSEEDPEAAGRLASLSRIPADMFPAYKTLFEQFIKTGGDNELNIQSAARKQLEQIFRSNDPSAGHIACFEQVAREVIKVCFILFFKFASLYSCCQ